MLACIFDGYVDEPACLGVPPYLSPYPRYIAGALEELDWDYVYLTVDEWRMARGERARKFRGRCPKDGWGSCAPARGRPQHWSVERAAAKWERAKKADLLIAHWGAVVPGKYLAATPASPRELGEMAATFRGEKYLGGSGVGYIEKYRPEIVVQFDSLLKGDADAGLYRLIDGGEEGNGKKRGKGGRREKRSGGDMGEGAGDDAAWGETGIRRTPDQRARWSAAGASLVKQHPDLGGTPHPDLGGTPRRGIGGPLLAEVESYRGCVRFTSGGCSFCSDVAFGEPEFREPGEVAREAAALAEARVRHMRVGGQTCIFSYMAEGVGTTETPRPVPGKVRELFSGIVDSAPGLMVLHTDNANPAVISAHPERSREVADILVELCTSGNVVALGLESADPAVREANNLNASAEDTMSAIALINEAGRERGSTGLPRLLPGVNFVTGLEGEKKSTLGLNRDFLKDILAKGLLLRRVNVRKAFLSGSASPAGSRIHASFKRWITDEFEPEMLKRLAPDGTLLRGVFMERTRGRATFGRQPGSYPLLTGVPYKTDTGRWLDIAITSRGSRSVGGVEVPLCINEVGLDALSALPGVGRKRAASIMRHRPIADEDQLAKVIDSPEVAESLRDMVAF